MKLATAKRIKSFLLIPLLLLTGTGLTDQKAIHVTVLSVAKLLFYPEYSAPATTISLNDSRISAETSGRILQIPVLVGESVNKGALLTELECTTNNLHLRQADANLISAKAQLTLATRQIKRTQSLLKDRNISEELLNQREADLKSARASQKAQQAAVEESKLAVSRCRVTAPFKGVILERLASEGEWITPGQPVIRLLDSERLEVSVQIPTDQVNSLNATTSFKFVSNQGSFPLQLQRMVPVVESRGRNREVRLLFSDKRALPGSSGRLIWQSRQSHLPADLPVRRGDLLGLFLAESGKARFQPLPDALEGHPVAVDLPASAQIIINGRQALSDGDTILVN